MLLRQEGLASQDMIGKVSRTGEAILARATAEGVDSKVDIGMPSEFLDLHARLALTLIQRTLVNAMTGMPMSLATEEKDMHWMRTHASYCFSCSRGPVSSEQLCFWDYPFEYNPCAGIACGYFSPVGGLWTW